MSFFDKARGAVHKLGGDVRSKFSGADSSHSHTHDSGVCSDGTHDHVAHNRYDSFAPLRDGGNHTKWYVDGCSYMWAVSMALEQAQESIYILDWWLSPELYLRRPPASNEQYRLDNMLKAAAERGVKVHVIVYKEVTQALTLSSHHTKHHLEDMHPNIAVVRHPDHLPDQKTVGASIMNTFKDFKLSTASMVSLPGDTLKAIYGVTEDSVLYWAHHEKLCLVDKKLAFMGGLDLCYGRWDTNQHSIADAHPGDINQTVFAGQDYNNSRIMDFQDVPNWQNNKLSRTESSRMGWSDVALSLTGPAVDDLCEHFCQRWNFIFEEKYHSRNNDTRYGPLQGPLGWAGSAAPGGDPLVPAEGDHSIYGLQKRFQEKLHLSEDHFGHHQRHEATHSTQGGSAQILRSATRWSHGCLVEHSIANAYIDTIRNSKSFVYIENQFFITATSDKQKPIENKIGAAIVERIIRAARNGEKYRVIVVMPAVPAFAGDLRDDGAIGTRAIMEYQYDSICRGGNSIYEAIAREGINPMDFIRFYNLRNYDRINNSSAMKSAEDKSGVPYDEARKEFDDKVGGGFSNYPPGDSRADGHGERPQYQSGALDGYQQQTQNIGEHQGLGSGRWDSVAECYMLGGEDIRNVPWETGNIDEIDAFVTEELYIHSKLLIADDRYVICGSANLNDRSQLGSHDSEIAILIDDRDTFQTTLNGQQHQSSRFAASLRRTLFRKHLGLIRGQNYAQHDPSYDPVTISTNQYDWDSSEDRAVADPLSDQFWSLWNATAKTNTDVFGKVFQPVPHDNVQSWADYDSWYEENFRVVEPGSKDEKAGKKAGKYKVGHVVRHNFPGGVSEVKEELSKVRGSLVEMPLLFLKNEDIAVENMTYNSMTAIMFT